MPEPAKKVNEFVPAGYKPPAPMRTDEPGTIRNDGVVQENGTLVPLNVANEVTVHEETRVVPKQLFSDADILLIKGTVARDCTDGEFKLLMYLAGVYGLDPIRKQIWAVKYGDSPASIFTGRDGFLEIAHRSGYFDGLKSWVEYETKDGKEDYSKPLKGHCIIWRKDMTRPFETEVLFSEYTTGKNLWQKKPSVMIIKVAESVCLRKAFSVSGLYSPEEM